MLICSSDGWVDNWASAVPTMWNYRGCAKYQQVAIYCLLPNGSVQIATPTPPKLSKFSKIVWRCFNQPKKLHVAFANANDANIETFKTDLVKAVNADGDLLTQFKSKATIISSIKRASTYEDLEGVYKVNGWAS